MRLGQVAELDFGRMGYIQSLDPEHGAQAAGGRYGPYWWCWPTRGTASGTASCGLSTARSWKK